MRVKYFFHKEKKLCCGKKNQFKAVIRFNCVGLPFSFSGCGITKKEAKIELLRKIDKENPGVVNDALIKNGFKKQKVEVN